jgi:hypothetical protein
MEEYCKMFEFSEEVIQGSVRNLEQIKTDITGIKKLWSHIQICDVKFKENFEIVWPEIKSMDMEDEVKKLKK